MIHDDHMYCEKCDRHARDCWCYAGNHPGEYERDQPQPESRCPGGEGHGWRGDGQAVADHEAERYRQGEDFTP